MHAPDLPIPSLPPSADVGANAVPAAGTVEQPRIESGGAFARLLEAISPPALDLSDTEADAPTAESLATPLLPAEEQATGLLANHVPPAPEGYPALENAPVAVRRLAPEPHASGVAPGETSVNRPGDALRTPPTLITDQTLAAQPPLAKATEAAAEPATSEAGEVVARPASILTPPAESEDHFRTRSDTSQRHEAPARARDGAALGDELSPAGANRRSVVSGGPIRPYASPSRTTLDNAAFDAAAPQSDRARTEAPTAAEEREVRDLRPAAPRSLRNPEHAPSEPTPEPLPPLPPTATLGAEAPASDPFTGPTVRMPAAGTPAETLPVHAQWLAARGGGTARVRLHPPELGEIELSVRVRGSSVQVSIQTEGAEAGRLALDGRELLVEALASRELRVEQLVVRSPDGVTTTATPGDSGDGSSEHLSEHREGSTEREGSRPEPQADASRTELQTDDHPVASGRAVDLRI